MSVKTFKEVTVCCKKKCYELISLSRQIELFDLFYIKDKSEQDAFLVTLMQATDCNRNSRNPGKIRMVTWIYIVRYGVTAVDVCKEMVLKLYQIGANRIKVVQDKLKNNTSLADQRGKHSNRPHKFHEIMTVSMKISRNT